MDTPDDYDAAADMAASIEECYRAIRERVARGGPPWVPPDLWHEAHRHDNRIPFETRLAVLERANEHCEHCGFTRQLELHHLNYQRAYGAELPEDLEALCRDCHESKHGLRA